jgi:hypothetical protein
LTAPRLRREKWVENLAFAVCGLQCEEWSNWWGLPQLDELLKDYPDLESEDLQQSLQFALAHMDGTIDLYLHAAGWLQGCSSIRGFTHKDRSSVKSDRLGCSARSGDWPRHSVELDAGCAVAATGKAMRVRKKPLIQQ